MKDKGDLQPSCLTDLADTPYHAAATEGRPVVVSIGNRGASLSHGTENKRTDVWSERWPDEALCMERCGTIHMDKKVETAEAIILDRGSEGQGGSGLRLVPL